MWKSTSWYDYNIKLPPLWGNINWHLLQLNQLHNLIDWLIFLWWYSSKGQHVHISYNYLNLYNILIFIVNTCVVSFHDYFYFHQTSKLSCLKISLYNKYTKITHGIFIDTTMACGCLFCYFYISKLISFLYIWETPPK